MSTLHDVAALELGGTATETTEPVSRQTSALVTRQAAPLPAATTPAAMIALAIDRGADVATLERLMALQERWEAAEARKAFVAALAKFKAAPPAIAKNKHVRFVNKTGTVTEYDHATLDQVASVIGAALSLHGLSHRWETEQGDGGRIRVTCILQHVMGHAERVTLQASPDESGGKNNIQAVGSTVSYLQRYTLLAATGLAASDQDDDAGGMAPGEMISAAEKQELVDLLRETGSDVTRFLAFFDVENLDVLPLARFAEARALLQQKAKRARA